jgi:hypothetical protein
MTTLLLIPQDKLNALLSKDESEFEEAVQTAMVDDIEALRTAISSTNRKLCRALPKDERGLRIASMKQRLEWLEQSAAFEAFNEEFEGYKASFRMGETGIVIKIQSPSGDEYKETTEFISSLEANRHFRMWVRERLPKKEKPSPPLVSTETEVVVPELSRREKVLQTLENLTVGDRIWHKNTDRYGTYEGVQETAMPCAWVKFDGKGITEPVVPLDLVKMPEWKEGDRIFWQHSDTGEIRVGTVTVTRPYTTSATFDDGADGCYSNENIKIAKKNWEILTNNAESIAAEQGFTKGVGLKVLVGRHKRRTGVLDHVTHGGMYYPPSVNPQLWVKIDGADEQVRLEPSQVELTSTFGSEGTETPVSGLKISFGWTTEYLENKTVTRRDWKDSHACKFVKAFRSSKTIQAYDKDPRYGGQVIGEILLTKEPFRQPLKEMTADDLIAEGGMCETVEQFVENYFDGDFTKQPWVVSFEFKGNDLWHETRPRQQQADAEALSLTGSSITSSDATKLKVGDTVKLLVDVKYVDLNPKTSFPSNAVLASAGDIAEVCGVRGARVALSVGGEPFDWFVSGVEKLEAFGNLGSPDETELLEDLDAPTSGITETRIDSAYCPDDKKPKWYKLDNGKGWSFFECKGCSKRCGESVTCGNVVNIVETKPLPLSQEMATIAASPTERWKQGWEKGDAVVANSVGTKAFRSFCEGHRVVVKSVSGEGVQTLWLEREDGEVYSAFGNWIEEFHVSRTTEQCDLAPVEKLHDLFNAPDEIGGDKILIPTPLIASIEGQNKWICLHNGRCLNSNFYEASWHVGDAVTSESGEKIEALSADEAREIVAKINSTCSRIAVIDKVRHKRVNLLRQAIALLDRSEGYKALGFNNMTKLLKSKIINHPYSSLQKQWQAARVESCLGVEIGTMPEEQCRKLLPLAENPEQMIQAYQDAQKLASNKRLTAKLIASAVAAIKGEKPKPYARSKCGWVAGPDASRHYRVKLMETEVNLHDSYTPIAQEIENLCEAKKVPPEQLMVDGLLGALAAALGTTNQGAIAAAVNFLKNSEMGVAA